MIEDASDVYNNRNNPDRLTGRAMMGPDLKMIHAYLLDTSTGETFYI